MSAFAVIYHRSADPAQAKDLQAVMSRLAHRGKDGSGAVYLKGAALAHWHFWVTPEERGETQPLASTPFTLVFDGRLDNRAELAARMNLAPAESSCMADSALALRAYARWGESSFAQLIGEYALAIFNSRSQTLTCARDPLGERSLYYAAEHSRVIVASEPWAIAALTGAEVDEVGAAHYFSWSVPPDGQTLFRGISELRPGEALTFSAKGQRGNRFWQPQMETKIRYRHDAQYAEHFLSLLKESVHARLRSIQPVGVLMSGGMDSSTLAGLAAAELAPSQLTALSHIFEDAELQACDERAYIEELQRAWNLRCVYIPCDDAWALKDNDQLPRNQNTPDLNAYRWMKEREYRRAQEEGLGVLLTGDFGDNLYGAGINWLADLLQDGRLSDAAKETRRLFRQYPGMRRQWQAGYLQRAIRRAVDALPGGARLRRKASAPHWLTPESARIFLETKVTESPAEEGYQALLGQQMAHSLLNEAYFASRQSVELRHPYRDRRLVEFMLAIPAYQLFWRGLSKYVLRTATQDLLPASVHAPRRRASLEAFFFRGMEKESRFIESFLQKRTAGWAQHVQPEAAQEAWQSLMQTRKNTLPPWMLISYEDWRAALLKTAPANG